MYDPNEERACRAAADTDHGREYVPENPIRLSPEQEACPHVGNLNWTGLEGVFRCVDCGAPLVCPELGEIIDLDVATEPLEF